MIEKQDKVSEQSKLSWRLGEYWTKPDMGIKERGLERGMRKFSGRNERLWQGEKRLWEMLRKMRPSLNPSLRIYGTSGDWKNKYPKLLSTEHNPILWILALAECEGSSEGYISYLSCILHSP